MKPVSQPLLDLLATRQFYAADLWTITLVGGTIYRFTSGDLNITANGLVYQCGGQVGPYWDRTGSKAKCHWSVGTSVDTLVVDMIPGSYQIFGVPILQAIKDGVFDGAEVMLERAFMPTYGDTSRGVIRFFVGRVAEVVSGRSLATFTINSHLELLNLQFPRNVVQAGCMNNWGDTACGVSQASYKTTGTLTGTPTVAAMTGTLAASFSAGTFDLGKIAFTSGVLNGYSETVKSCGLSGTTATIALTGFLPNAPSAGDTFELYYGCNKSYTDSNGCPKFSNTARFRGMPWTPQPSLSV
jgi:uncharacterized phage protein (TIGR02218 family)